MTEEHPPDETPLGMARFGPGIGEQQEGARDRTIGQPIHQVAGIIGPDADVGNVLAFNLAQQGRDAVAIDLATDHECFGIAQGLPGEMLAGAETDFEPARGGHRSRGIESEPRKQRLHQALLARAKAPADAPAVKIPWSWTLRRAARVFVVRRSPAQWRAAFRLSTRSRRSQEKPPSGSGLRPKWP